jgi:hypothetical protein
MVIALVLASPAGGAWPQDKGADHEKDKNEIVVKTPWGSMEAKAAEDTHELNLPIYPGAQLLNDKESSPLSASLQFNGKPGIKFVVGKFVTPDSREKVRAFYQKKLGKQVSKFTEKDEDGSTVFEIEHKLDQRYVALKNHGAMTEVDLIHLAGVESDDHAGPSKH